MCAARAWAFHLLIATCALAHGLVLGVAPSGVAAGEPVSLERSLEVARHARPSIVRIQWRRRGVPADVVERHAIVVDPEGWLLMAGPPPSPEGTLAAKFADDRHMRATVWASDPKTCLTLLQVPVAQLPALTLRTFEGRVAAQAAAPLRLPAGQEFLMVTAEGAVARGALRGSHRRRMFRIPVSRVPVEVCCLDEAAATVVSTDLGAPWLDPEGRVIGLLVGADTGTPKAPDEVGEFRLRPEVTAAYAVPARVVSIVWPLLRLRREVQRSALGILTRPVSEALSHHLCPGCGGYEVLDVAPGGPAQRAGIARLDVIRAIGGRKLAPQAVLSDILLPHRPGAEIALGILRRGEEAEVQVHLGRSGP